MSGTGPLATIMIPTYGQAELLAHAIDSALAQTYAPLEVIVADDASPDATAAVVSDYLADPRLRYVRRERNLGRTANYRTTLRHDATGVVALNLDGDDWLLDPNYLAEAMELYRERPELALVFARADDFSARTGTYEETSVNRNLERVNSGTDLLRAYADGSVSIPHATALYRRDRALAANFYAYDCVGSDTIALLSLLPGNSVGFVDVVAAAWNKHDDNATFRTSATGRLSNDRLVVDVPAEYVRSARALSERELATWQRRMGARWGLSYLEDCAVAGQYGAALHYLLATITSRPATGASLVLAALRKGTRRFAAPQHRAPAGGQA